MQEDSIGPCTPQARRTWTRAVLYTDRPALSPGSFVWRGRAGYVAELVERHGTEWVAGVVAAGDAPRAHAKMRFIPVGELNWT